MKTVEDFNITKDGNVRARIKYFTPLAGELN